MLRAFFIVLFFAATAHAYTEIAPGDLPAHGTPAQATDAILTYDSSAAEGSRQAKILLSGDATDCFTGTGVWSTCGSGDGDLLADGTVPLTAAWDVGAFGITAETFTSDVAIGTAPFTVTSTTKVSNLNCDLLDDLSSAALQPVDAGLTSIAGLSVTNGDIIYATAADTYAVLDSGTANYLLQANGVGAPSWTSSISISAIDLGSGTFDVPISTADVALADAGKVSLNTTDEQLSFHSAADGEISGEVALSLIQHTSITFDPAWAYDQETTNRSVPLFKVGDDFVEGLTITEWRVAYVGGDPTTELDADLICDTTPDFAVGAGATVMDVLDTTAGASTADTGFDSASCANGSNIYIHFGADPTDANVLITVDVWYYAEED